MTWEACKWNYGGNEEINVCRKCYCSSKTARQAMVNFKLISNEFI